VSGTAGDNGPTLGAAAAELELLDAWHPATAAKAIAAVDWRSNRINGRRA
jgi:hypothetical protein